jgi:beta-lactam-binding protein with PASTA domain
MARQVPTDLEDALAANRAARDRFWSMPAAQKDAWVGWIDRARLPRARRRRIAEAVQRFSGPTGKRETAVAAEPAAVALPREDWWTWVIGLVLLAALAGFLVWLTVYRHHNSSKPAAVVVASKATVPKVTGIRVQAAQFQLRQAKLGTKVVHKAATKPKGIVVGQAPKDGSTVPQGTAVTLLVSNGPPGVGMPDVTGLAAADAVKALQARGLTPTLKQVASTAVPGTVLAQSPQAGKRAKRGAPVVLQVAKGRAAVSVPDVTGQSQQQAASALQQAGLKATVAKVPSTQPAGTVVAQNPAAGQKVSQGSGVRLNVAKGTVQATTTTQAATTTAPVTTTKPPATGNDYTGMRLTEAVQKIVQGRQQVTVQYVASTQPAGVVVSNSNAGSRVRLQVSAGAHPKPNAAVPDVSGEDTTTAQSDLAAAGFSVIQAPWPVSDSSQAGTVVYETPAAGQQVPRGAAIVIYVGAASGG